MLLSMNTYIPFVSTVVGAGHRKEWCNTSSVKTKEPAKVPANRTEKVTVVDSEQRSNISVAGPSANGLAELSNESFRPWMLVKKKYRRPQNLGRGREDNKLGKRPQNANGPKLTSLANNPSPHMLPSSQISTPLEKNLMVGENSNIHTDPCDIPLKSDNTQSMETTPITVSNLFNMLQAAEQGSEDIMIMIQNSDGSESQAAQLPDQVKNKGKVDLITQKPTLVPERNKANISQRKRKASSSEKYYGRQQRRNPQGELQLDLSRHRSRERSISPHHRRLVDRRSQLVIEPRVANPYGSMNNLVKVSPSRPMVRDRLRVRKILGTPDYVPLPNHPKSFSIKLVVWNCRGAGNKIFRRTMKELVKIHKPSIIVLMETKVGFNSMGMFFNKMNFTASTHIDPTDRRGGIWVIWDPVQVTVRAFEANDQVIHAKIKRDSYPEWILYSVYASPNLMNKALLWDNLEAMANNMTEPWLVAGDFNDIASNAEKRSVSTIQSQTNSRKFVARMNRCNLMDLGVQVLILLGLMGDKALPILWNDLTGLFVTQNGGSIILKVR
ncbi:uncharacterized protein LOC114273709 [Camellia sinensis]|uniref:uncharacterized protein LOC114273709 n=1 Tax=Camellia sinensis TaxID=4442 RepID=UPI001035B82A|nr:uncharacterized protein LOC114273709 [Camellia sinensis]